MNPEHPHSPQQSHQPVKPASSGAPLANDVIHANAAYIGHMQHPTNSSGQKDKKPGRKWWPHTKKQWIITGIIAVLLIGAGVGAYFIWFKPKPKDQITVQKSTEKPVPPPVPIVSNLSGVVIPDASINDRPVTGIMIENSPTARPQSGLDQASVVFEAVAEGGITRFLALYQDTEPGYIGPVRSVRPYYLQWLLGFDAAVAHVGGSGDALRLIKEWNVKDLDQFANPGAFHRISSRYAPHNMYTSIGALREVENKKGYGKSIFTSLLRKPGAPHPTPDATSIDMNISGADYNTHYDYDASTNSYKRMVGGAPSMNVDAAGKQTQLAPQVVVALIMPKGNSGVYSTYGTLGSGQAVIFQDGVATPGTWHKPDNASQFTFTDPQGKAIALNPGQTWFTALGSIGSVTYR